MKISVLYCFDGNFWQPVTASIASLLASSPAHTFDIYVMSSTVMDQEQLTRLGTFVTAQNGRLLPLLFAQREQIDSLPVHGHLTTAMYLRLFAPQALPSELDRVIYLDSDTIVCADVGRLWEHPLGTCLIGAAREPYDESHRKPLGFTRDDFYVNSGVILMDLQRLRANDVVAQFLTYARHNRALLRSPDQDMLNAVLRGQICDIGLNWNWQAVFPRFLPHELHLTVSEFEHHRRHPSIIHYTSSYKPWFFRFHPHYRGEYKKALDRTYWRGVPPPDRHFSNVGRRSIRFLQQTLEWYLPSVARILRTRRISA